MAGRTAFKFGGWVRLGLSKKQFMFKGSGPQGVFFSELAGPTALKASRWVQFGPTKILKIIVLNFTYM